LTLYDVCPECKSPDRERGGEEKSAQRIFEHASEVFDVEKLWWDSRDWDGAGVFGKFGQIRKMFYNPESARALRNVIGKNRPDVIMCHNIYQPLFSPSPISTTTSSAKIKRQTNNMIRALSEPQSTKT